MTAYIDPREIAVEAVATRNNELAMKVVHWMQELSPEEAQWLVWATQFGLQYVQQMSDPATRRTEEGEVWDI